jgi:hypothetical protein
MAATPDGLDSFELKLNFDADQIENALRVFGFDPDKGKPRKIWFGEVVDGLDGPDTLPLAARGIILRVRRKKKGGDVTVKLRGPDGCVDVTAWRDGAGSSPHAKVEGDWAAKRLVSASLGRDLDEAAAVREMDVTKPSLTSLLTAEQLSLITQLLVPLPRVPLLPPIMAKKWEAVDEVEAELWEVDHLRFLEISVLVKDDPAGAMERLRKRATGGGLSLTANQETKTTTVLRHLATRP